MQNISNLAPSAMLQARLALHNQWNAHHARLCLILHQLHVNPRILMIVNNTQVIH